VAAAEVLHDAWPAAIRAADRSCLSPRIGRSRARQPTVISFDAIVGVLLGDVRGRRDEFGQHPQVRAGLVRRHLDRRRPIAQRVGEEPAGRAAVSRCSDIMTSMTWPNWSTARYRSCHRPATLT